MVKITMVNSILVTGKNGQLGQSLQKMAKNYPQYDFTFVGREVLDLSKSQSIASYFEDKSFDVIINCAAYTAVDKAESEPKLADQVNHLAVKQLAEIAKIKDIMLIHISTDYVFNGQSHKPYTELDSTDPQSVYGLTKLKGEQAIQKIDPKAIIIRTSWVYSEYGNNFVKTMLRLGKEQDVLRVVSDQYGCPTWAGAIATVLLNIVTLLEDGKMIPWGVYHYSGQPSTSWHGFAETIFEQAEKLGIIKRRPKLESIKTSEYPAPAKRPLNSVFDCLKIAQEMGISQPSCHAGLNEVLKSWKEQ